MDEVWSERDTTPARIEAALRNIVVEHHHSDHPFVPARVLNVVVVVDGQFRGEIENRFERVGRYHPSRLVLCAVEDGPRDDRRVGGRRHRRRRAAARAHRGRARARRARRSARATSPSSTRSSTRCWSPTSRRWCGRRTATPRRSTRCAGSRRSCSSTRQDEPDVAESLERAADLAEHAYVVDLAWLRSTPWRERVAAAFDPPALRAALGQRLRGHRPPPPGLARRRAAVLRLAVVAARLEARVAGAPRRRAHRPRARPPAGGRGSSSSSPTRTRPGLAGVTIETAAGEAVSLDRAPGGLQAVRRARDGSEQSWTVLGASRGEGGILGEGVRQALLRDPTYRPALACARVMVVSVEIAVLDDPADGGGGPARAAPAAVTSCSPAARRRSARTSSRPRATPTGAARRSGSATSAACRPTTSSRTSRWPTRRCSRASTAPPEVMRMQGELGPDEGAAAYEAIREPRRRAALRPRPARPGPGRAHRLAVPGPAREARARPPRGRRARGRDGAATCRASR